jgi:PAS domain S-box-containing protein
MLHDLSDIKRLLETVEQIFEKGSSPIVMVCIRRVLVPRGRLHPRARCHAAHADFLRHASLQINEQGIIQKYNECAVETFGYSKEEAIGQNIKMLMPQDVADKHDGYLRRYVETGVKHVIGANRFAKHTRKLLIHADKFVSVALSTARPRWSQLVKFIAILANRIDDLNHTWCLAAERCWREPRTVL